MLNPALQRAQLLFQQRRYDMAADALREALFQSPQDGFAHALLSLCLVNLKKYEEAGAEAQAAIHQEPDQPFCHYALAAVCQDRNRFDEAETAIREAIRLSPEDPDYWALLSQTMISRQRWREALDAADRGLMFDSEHNLCVNLRGMALVKLGDKQAAARTLDEALARNPHSSLSHANQGWTLLHQGKPKEALQHFSEALRINPNNEWARDGMIQALKARYFIYRAMLRYYLWMASFNRRGQWAIVIGMWIGFQVLQGVNASYPALAPVIFPLLAGYVLFALASWLADPFFNLTLLATRFGRHLLTTIQKICAVAVGLLVPVGATLVLLGIFQADFDAALVVGIFLLALTFPVATTSKARPGKPVIITGCYTLAVAAAGVTGIVMMVMNIPGGFNVFQAGLWGALLSSVAGNILLGMVPRR